MESMRGLMTKPPIFPLDRLSEEDSHFFTINTKQVQQVEYRDYTNGIGYVGWVEGIYTAPRLDDGKENHIYWATYDLYIEDSREKAMDEIREFWERWHI